MDFLLTTLNFAGLAYAGYACFASAKEVVRINSDKRAVLASAHLPIASQSNADLNAFKEGSHWVFLEIAKNRVSRSAFLKRVQSVPVQLLREDRGGFIEGQCGDGFVYAVNGEKIRVEMNECNVDDLALDRRVMPIMLHDTHATKHCDIVYSLKQMVSLGLFGSLSYNIDKKQFLLDTLFLMPLKSQEACLTKLSNYFNFKEHSATFEFFLWATAVGVLLTIALFRNGMGVRKEMSRGAAVVWDERRVLTRAEERLKCRCGRNMNVVGECNHLSMCCDCHKLDPICKICGITIDFPKIIYI